MSLAGRRSKAASSFASLAVTWMPFAVPVLCVVFGSAAVGTRCRPSRRTVTDGARAPCGREVAAVDSESIREDDEAVDFGAAASSGSPLKMSSPLSEGPGSATSDDFRGMPSPLKAGSMGRSATAKVSESSTQPWAHACSSCVTTSIEDPNRLAAEERKGEGRAEELEAKEIGSADC